MSDHDQKEPKIVALRMLRQMFRHSLVVWCFTPDCEHLAEWFSRGEFLCRECYRKRREEEAK
jgi:hypothetical protein